MSEALIRVRNLRVVREERPICVVDSLDVAPGDQLLLQGPNGSGKTTLLRVLAGLEQDFDGHCDVQAPTIKRVYVHQSPYMLRGTVLDNILMGLRGNGVPRREQPAQARELVDQMGLGSRLMSSATRLSGGEQRRVAIVRALAAAPDLLLLDEPFADLDEGGVDTVRQLLAARPQITVVVAAPGEISLGEAGKVHRLGEP
ncbi:MAG: ATP-binding cassette domain-containing protein [Gemmatimonadetes bacterium]|nr:ATP-binding cassette domain-containing protein [Gemmatimonadota bacterium]